MTHEAEGRLKWIAIKSKASIEIRFQAHVESLKLMQVRHPVDTIVRCNILNREIYFHLQ